MQKKLFKANGITLLATEYKNSSTPLLSRCDVCDHEWSVTYSNVQSGHGCPSCAKREEVRA